MRLAVISDIHGNWQALEAVLDDIHNNDVNAIICLGDNIGYGPEPEKVVQELIKRNIVSVIGNHELALLSNVYYDRLNFITRDSLDITRKLLSSESMSWISSLKPSIVSYDARFVHGCPPASITTYLFTPSEKKLGKIFARFSEQLCFSGHTHSLDLFAMKQSGAIDKKTLHPGSISLDRNNRYIIIPGSVGQPRDNSSDRAKYGIWDQQEHTLEIRHIGYDVDTTIRLMEELHFPLSNSRRLKWQKKT